MCSTSAGRRRSSPPSMAFHPRGFDRSGHPFGSPRPAIPRRLSRRSAERPRRRCRRAPVPWPIGIGAPGPLDPVTGVIEHSTNLGWYDLPLAAMISDRFGGVPARLNDDGNTGALGEARAGAGRGADPFVFLTLGTGLGSGIVVDGRIVIGAHGAAGEVGHLAVGDRNGPRCGCGRRNCVETWCGGDRPRPPCSGDLAGSAPCRRHGRPTGCRGDLRAGAARRPGRDPTRSRCPPRPGDRRGGDALDARSGRDLGRRLDRDSAALVRACSRPRGREPGSLGDQPSSRASPAGAWRRERPGRCGRPGGPGRAARPMTSTRRRPSAQGRGRRIT